MEITSLNQMLVNMGLSLAYAILTLIVASITLYLIDHFIYRNVNFIEEIKKGNVAASIFYSVVLLFVAIIVSTSIN